MKDESLNKNPHLGFLNNIEWMNAQASEIFISVNDRNHPELPVLSASQEWGMIYRDEGGMNIFHDVANEITYKRVRPGQFVIHLRSFQGGFAHSKVEGITSPAYTILDFKDKNKHNDLFWKYVLTSDEFIKRLELITYGIRDGRSINFSDFSTLKFQFPSYEVQQKIGSLLSHVDSLIQAKTKKLESLKAVKKSLLQKCFPKAGEKVPEMRFAGFSGDWEKVDIGTYYEFKNGLNKEKEFFGCGTPIVNYTDVYHNRGIKSNEIKGTVMLSKEELNSFSVHKGDMFFTRTSETIDEIGYPCVMLDEPQNTVFSGFLLRCRAKKDDPLENIFKKYVFFTDAFRQEMMKKSSITTRALTSGTSIKKMFFSYPSKEEQIQIGLFFSKYDVLISAQQKEIDKLKDIKKSLLQKMFI